MVTTHRNRGALAFSNVTEFGRTFEPNAKPRKRGRCDLSSRSSIRKT